jgi:hypothetical protein
MLSVAFVPAGALRMADEALRDFAADPYGPLPQYAHLDRVLQAVRPVKAGRPGLGEFERRRRHAERQMVYRLRRAGG